jgi:hypothetical protein
LSNCCNVLICHGCLSFLESQIGNTEVRELFKSCELERFLYTVERATIDGDDF